MIPLYSDCDDARPLMYIDQNIIDSLRKGHYSFRRGLFEERFRAVYSDETLREIMRAEDGGGKAEEYLKVLERLEAFHLRLQLNGQFAPTGNAIIQSSNPTAVYQNFIQTRDFDDLIEANLLVSRKFMGGLSEYTVDDIVAQMLAAFERNNETLEQNIKNLEHFLPNAKEELTRLFNSSGAMKVVPLEDYKRILGDLADSLKNNLKINDSSQSPLSRYREELKLHPKSLNNLESPRIVEQVWQVISSDKGIKESGVNINQFFGVDVSNPIHTERKNFLSEQVASVYFHLNLAGYCSDKGLNQQRRFASSFSDLQHVSLATHCDYLLSSDERLIKKATASYEFTNANTEAVFLNLSDIRV